MVDFFFCWLILQNAFARLSERALAHLHDIETPKQAPISQQVSGINPEKARD